MVISLAKDCYLRRSDFICPASRHIAVTGEQHPTLTTYFLDYLGVEDVLSFVEMLIMRNDAHASFPQFCGQVVGPKVSVGKDDRIRRQSM